MKQTLSAVGLAMLFLLTWALAVGAQVPDHLKCYKVKDPIAKGAYTADLGGLAPEAGCVIKLPGKLLCVETTKTNVSPTPPGAAPGNPAGQFLCYKVKCPKVKPPGIPWTDQFGGRTLQPAAPKMLCAPRAVSTTTITSTTTTTSPPCISGGCAPCGSCGNGECHLTGGGGGCGTIDNNPQCVDASACTQTNCTAHGQCGPGRVCVVNGGSTFCCDACP